MKVCILIISLLILSSAMKHNKLDEDNQCLNEQCGVDISICFEDYKCFDTIQKCAPQENVSKKELQKAEQCVKQESEAAYNLLDCAIKKCVNHTLKKKQLNSIKQFMKYWK